MNTKKTLISIGVACAIAAPLAAFSQTTVYGRIDIGVDRTETATSILTAHRDNASRLGFRGNEDLGGGLKTVYGVEFGFAADTGEVSSPMLRNSFVGFTGSAGAFAMGRLDSNNPTGSPLYSLITRHTEFVIHDAGATATGTAVFNARNRVSNAIGYSSPEISGIVFRARYYFNGESLPGTFDLRQTDLSASYGGGKDTFGVGMGYGRDDRNTALPLNAFKDKWMLVGSYDFGVVRAWAVLGQDNYESGPTSRDAVFYRQIGASVPVGSSGSKVIANLMTRDVQTDRLGVLEKSQIGYAHALSRRSLLFALFDVQNSNNRLPTATARRTSLGMQHNF